MWGFLKRSKSENTAAEGATVAPAWLSQLPSKVLVCDVETTGLTSHDRIVTFAGIGMTTAPLASGQFNLSYSYLIFDPGRKNNPQAQRIHGYTDWVLKFQNPFSVYADELWRFISSYDLIVAHNASFDISFIDRELVAAGFPALSRPIFCTMQGYRALGMGGSASLDAICARIKLARASNVHGALEDAWLALQVYLWLHNCPLHATLPDTVPLIPTNFHEAPPPLESLTRAARGARHKPSAPS